MPVLRVALAQVDVTVGDLAGNAAVVLDRTAEAARGRRPPRRLPRDDAHRLPARGPGAAPVVPGGVAGRPRDSWPADLAEAGLGERRGDRRLPRRRRPAAQRARVLLGGQVVARYFKHHLPNYGVFDEHRYFVPGDSLRRRPAPRCRHRADDLRGRLAGRRPVRRGRQPPASAWSSTSTARRTSATRTTCGCRCCSAGRAEAGRPVVYVNTVGGQDELVFDGDSMVVVRRRRACCCGRRSTSRASSWSTSPSPLRSPRPSGRHRLDCRWP